MGLVVHLNPFRETLGISWPTQFTDMETEGQSRETHGQVLVARSSDSPGACSFQGTFGQKQLCGAQPLEKRDRAGPGEDPHVARCMEQAPFQPGVQANPA